VTPLSTIAPVLLLVGSCTPLTTDPWSVTDAGNVGVFGQLGIYEDFKTTSEFTVEDPGAGTVVVEQSYDMIGQFGLIGGVEYFLAKDLSLLGGVDLRGFEPEKIEGFALDDVTTFETFVGLRWIAPPRWLREGRLRSFLEAGLNYVPSTSFSGEVDISTIAPGAQNPTFEFNGDSYWKVGTSAGLLYQFADRWIGQLRFTYEFPLFSTKDQVVVAIPPTTLTYEMGVKQEPEGLLVQVGLSYYF